MKVGQENRNKTSLATYCKLGNIRECFIFAKLRICEVSLWFTDIGKIALVKNLKCRKYVF